MLGNKAIGAVSGLTEGKSTTDAGPDFTPLQLQTLKVISDALAPCLALCAKQ